MADAHGEGSSELPTGGRGDGGGAPVEDPHQAIGAALDQIEAALDEVAAALARMA